MQNTARRPKITVSDDGRGIVSQAGALLLTETARVSGLQAGLLQALSRRRPGRAVHDPGKIVTDLAVALGGDCLADAGVLRAEPELFGPVASKGAYNSLFLGLRAVALFVGGVGIANVMVISVLGRRAEIGLRRTLGASRRRVGAQFLAEAVLLSLLGGLAGTAIGVAATASSAVTQHWSVQFPALALYGGLSAALGIGAIAGLYPAMRAARLSPTEALRTV